MKKMTAILLVLCLIMGGCGRQETKEPIDYTVQLETTGGMAIPGITVYIYADTARTDLFAVARTDENGQMSFSGPESDSYVAVLEGVGPGYGCEESYPVTAPQTRIVLKPQLLQNADLNTESFGLGSVMFDFTMTAADGTEYTLSSLLEQKKAVVLNFWYTNCGPCKMEFPYMQEAYTQYSDKLEILALNPVDGNDAAIAQFQSDNGLTFPVFKCGQEWEKAFGLRSYPTTVIIDRYGVITMVHGGMIDNTETFAKIFAAFTADDYTQKLVKHMDEL